MNKKQIPPYGCELKDAFRSGYKLTNDLFICLGRNAWNVAKGFKRSGNAALVLPAGSDPKDYDWSLVNNKSVLLLATEPNLYQLIRKLAYALLSQGRASIVRAASITGGRAIFRRYGGSHE